MRRLILHIGMPKSGTTALQQLLTNNSQVENILYPDKFKDNEGVAHHKLVELIKGDHIELFNMLHDVEGEKNEIFLSSEALFNIILDDNADPLSPNSIIGTDFYRFLSSSKDFNYQIHLVFTIRPLIDYIWSIYLQQIKSGDRRFAQEFTEYFDHSVPYILSRIAALKWLSSTYTVHVLKYCKDVNTNILNTFFTNFPRTPKCSSVQSSNTPSLLLHSFFDWLHRTDYQLDTRLRWDLVGADLNGKFFDRNDNNFAELIHPKRGAFDEDLVQRILDAFFCGITDGYTNYLIGSRNRVHDLGRYIGDNLQLGNCRSYITQNSDKYGKQAASKLLELLDRFSESLK